MARKKTEPKNPEGKKGQRLTVEQQTFIVVSLACYHRPSTVQKNFKDMFGRDVIPQTIHAYDPMHAHGKRGLAKKWVDLFNETRKKYTDDLSIVPIASALYRMQELQDNYDTLKSRNNIIGANAILEQAAKEQGGAYTNKRQLSGPNGGPITIRGLADFYADQPAGAAAA
jgi:hypothetical protein